MGRQPQEATCMVVLRLKLCTLPERKVTPTVVVSCGQALEVAHERNERGTHLTIHAGKEISYRIYTNLA